MLIPEPSFGLAPLVIREISRIVAGLRQTGVFIIVTERNARAALHHSNCGYTFETGAVALERPSAILAADPRIAASYLGHGAAGASVRTARHAPQRP